MLTLGSKINKYSTPIGYVDGGNDREKLIFLTLENIDMTQKERDEIKNKYKNQDIDISQIMSQSDLQKKVKKVYGGNIKLNTSDYTLLTNLVNAGITPKDERLKGIYTIMKGGLSEKDKPMKSLDIYDGHIKQIPKIVMMGKDSGKMIFRHYLAGPSQSGKSTYAAGLIKEYKSFNGAGKIYLFSDTKEDELLDKLGVIRISLDNDLVDKPIESDELTNSLCVFDDVDSIVNKDIKKSVNSLKDQILQKGRHNNISCICTSHQITNYKESRIVLNECQFITLFPKATAKRNIVYVLKNYFGMDEDEISKLLDLPSRFITIHKEYPRYCVWSGGVYIL